MRPNALWRVSRIAILLMSFAIASIAVPLRDADTHSRTSDLVDINRASTAALKSLPGIQDAYAAAIVKNRPYKNKKQLLSKQVIPEAVYGKIKNRIIAKQ
jgi:competence protein ComEA